MEAPKKPVCLVSIDTKTGQHSAYSGKTKVASSAFSRPLSAEELEYFRKYPVKYLECLDQVTEEQTADTAA